MAVVSLRLPDDLSERLQKLADRTGRSKTYYMLEAIKEHLNDLEDLRLAELRLRSVRAGRMGTVPLDEVMKRYGPEG
jgi:RHH-type transcriptional regulator, rel operon repressor / antitoxin RelB